MEYFKDFLKTIGRLKEGYMPEKILIEEMEAYYVCKTIEPGTEQYTCDGNGIILSLNGETYRADRSMIMKYLGEQWYNYLLPYMDAAKEQEELQEKMRETVVPNDEPAQTSEYPGFTPEPITAEQQTIQQPQIEEIDTISSDDITYVAAAVRIMKGNAPSYMSSKVVVAPITKAEQVRIVCWYEINGRSGILLSGEDQPVYVTDGENETFFKVLGKMVYNNFKVDFKGVGEYNTDNRIKEGGKGGHIVIRDEGVTVHIIPKSFNINSPEFFYYIAWDDGNEVVGDNKGGMPEFYHNGVKYGIRVNWEVTMDGKKIMHAAVAPVA